MIRTFHNIGQGAFYTEEFYGLTMVYDCGGSRKEIIEDKIRNTFNENKTIDKLFISHFHNDHINGLQFLLSYCNVKTVYLPLLHKKLEIQFLIENIIFGENDLFIGNLITNPEDTIRDQNRDTRVIRVKPRGSNFKEDENSDNLIPSGHEVPLDNSGGNCKWVFVPYNFQYDLLSTLLCDVLEDKKIDINDFENELKEKEKEIIESYKAVLGGTKNFNANSLVLYSGPQEDCGSAVCISGFVDSIGVKRDCTMKQMAYINLRRIYSLSTLHKERDMSIAYIKEHNFSYYDFIKPGCLYLGDYNVFRQATMDNLKFVYDNYWNQLGTVQVPHHGSKYNFNSDLVEKNILAIMSAGKRRRHPHGVTLKAIMAKKATPLIVTEDNDTQIIQAVHV